MTFEEFKKNAGVEPALNCKSIFKVEMFFLGMWDMNDNGEKIAPYVESTSLDFDVPEVYYFLTFEEAKKQILSEQAIHSDSFHSARVLELPIGLPIHNEEYLSITVFDKNTDVSFSSKLPTIEGLTDAGGQDIDTTFFGYSGTDMPYNEGDIVEALDIENDLVRLGIVIKSPITLEYNWNRCQETGSTIDVMDRFKVMIGEDECEYFGTDMIFKPSFPISEDIRSQLHKWYEKRQSKDTTDFAGLLELL